MHYGLPVGVILPKQEAVFCSEKLVGVVKTTSFSRELMVRQGLLSSTVRQRRFVIPLVKASKSTAAEMSDGGWSCSCCVLLKLKVPLYLLIGLKYSM